MKKINEKYNQADVWPDGSCIKNPGPGGWGAIIQLSMQHDDNNLGTNKDKPFKISGYEAHTTNNRMELTAIIEALLFLQKQNINYEQTQINVYTDSTYLQQGINQWLDKWLRNNWHTSSKEPVKNQDLWQRLHALKHDSIQFSGLRVMAQCKNNKLADDLARAEARNLIKDSQCYQPHKINQDDLDQRALALHAQSPSGKVTTIPANLSIVRRYL